jgi:predicted permease
VSKRKEFLNRLFYFGRRERVSTELDEEIRLHIEMRTAELERKGIPPREAALRARREFGSAILAGQESRAAWKFRWMEDFAIDLKLALRGFRRSPAFALTAILSIALGIGGASAIFSALNAVLWSPLPVKDPQQLVAFSVSRDRGGARKGIPTLFARQLEASKILSGMTVETADGLSLTYDGRAERVIGEVVSPSFFDLLGVKMYLGQGFTSAVRAGHWAPEAVISYGFWMRRFGGDPSILGRTIRLNTYPFTIVGVSERLFCGLDRGTNYELRIPVLPAGQELAQIKEISGKQEWSGLVARLSPGTTIAEAQFAWDAQFQEFLATAPVKGTRGAIFRHVQVLPIGRGFLEYVQPFQTSLYVLLALAGVVLLIVCFNVANMLLARGTTRAREFAIRTSIGAGRFRLIRQMLAEAILLSVIGGALGLAVANWVAAALIQFLPQGHISLDIALRPDWRVFGFAFAISLGAGIVFGLVPALKSTQTGPAAALKNDSAASAGGDHGAAIRKSLVALQVTLSLALIVAAGVFVRTASALRPTDYRSDPERVLLVTLKPQQEIYTAERKERLASELVQRISAIPGVQSAALAEDGPFGSRTDLASMEIPGHPATYLGDDVISPGFFATVGIPLIAGRDFDERDVEKSALVIVVNQALVRAWFPNQNPLGQKLKFPTGVRDEMYEIVGVTADAHYYDLHSSPEPFVWFSMGQNAPYMPTLHVRANTGDMSGVTSAVRREFDLVDTGFPIFNVRTMAARIEDSLSGERMIASLAGAFGILALLLAAVGLYGVLAYSVSRRTREIGIRMALGAGRTSVLWMIAREVFALVGIGVVAGAVVAIVSTRALSHYLAGLASASPSIVLASAFGIFVVAGLAVIFPAIRGARIDPLIALRHD